MSPASAPRVSIGLPVYNGEPYLAASLDSLLTQTFEDFELIICDNGSTDGTVDYCRALAAHDPRIRVYENETNLGVFGNHRRVFEHARGEYLLWAAHDDIRAPEYLARCVAALDAHPEISICHTALRLIDEHGDEIRVTECPLDGDNPDPAARFASMIRMDHRLEPIMGMFRRRIVESTGAHASYPDSDRTLLAAVALHGPFLRLPEVLFSRREHATRSIRAHPTRHERARWINPQKRTPIAFPYHRQLFEYLRVILFSDARLGLGTRVACLGHLARWVRTNRRQLRDDYKWNLRLLYRFLRDRIAPRPAVD